jgi:putative transposase
LPQAKKGNSYKPSVLWIGSSWENGYVKSFIGKMMDALLNGEIFATLWETRVLTERWRRENNRYRPYNSLGNKAPVPEASS